MLCILRYCSTLDVMKKVKLFLGCSLLATALVVLLFGYSEEYKLMSFEGGLSKTGDIYLRPFPMIQWNMRTESRSLSWLRGLGLEARSKLAEGPIYTIGYRNKLGERADFKELAECWFDEQLTELLVADETFKKDMQLIIIQDGLLSEQMLHYWKGKKK